MIRELFVYGTLMQDTGSPMSRFLHDQAKVLGIASLFGRLYDLGSYPGAVYDAEEKQQITGQIYQLKNPLEVFPILDEYEGVSDRSVVREEYIRALVPAQLNGQQIPCWIYLYNLDTQHLPLIPSGNYLTYYRKQVAHRRFIETGR